MLPIVRGLWPLFGSIAAIALLSLPPALKAEDKLSAAPADSFSVVLIPDTQAYLGAGTKGDSKSTAPVTNPIFDAHVSWIAANLERQQIAFVSHVGDIVDIDEPRQWKVAQECMNKLHGRVPYGISVGNHDMTSKGDSRLFQEYFPASRFREFTWYGGCFAGSKAVVTTGPAVSGNNANSFQLFTAGKIDWLFLHLECNAPDDVLQWAQQAIDQYPDRKILITSHMGWGPEKKPANNDEFISGQKGRMQWIKIHGARGNTPQQMWDKFYSQQKNLIAVFTGDQSRTQAIHASTPGVHGNVIHELLQDYGSGWLRMYRFFPDQNRIQAITFQPKTEQLCQGTTLVPKIDMHQFELQADFKVQR
ncbi:MAG: metallophosphoesterase [Pirellulaceae bacterium]|nr:metallophosphoesterase [Pirellulaceae bacterium]